MALAAPVAREVVKDETTTLLHSRAARRGGFITGGLLFAFVYGLVARRRRLERMEEKLDEVVDEITDGDDDAEQHPRPAPQ